MRGFTNLKKKEILINQPVLSEDAKSYQTILEEIFGIKEQFGESVEKDLRHFYDFKKKILKGEESLANEEFSSFYQKLSSQSIELETIIGMEIRQLQRIKGTQEIAQA